MGEEEDYSWIKVRRHVDDEAKTWEERYRALEKHHEAETRFLVREVEKTRTRLAAHGQGEDVPKRARDLTEERLDERVRLLHEVCTWLAAAGRKDAADMVHDGRDRFLLPLARQVGLDDGEERDKPMTTPQKMARDAVIGRGGCAAIDREQNRICIQPKDHAGQCFEDAPFGFPRSAKAGRQEIGSLPPTDLWVDHERQCSDVSPDGDHSCTIERGHVGAHVEIDPVFGNPRAWPPRSETVVLRPGPGALEAVLARRGVVSTPEILESMRDAYDIGKLQARDEHEAAQVANGELLNDVLEAVREETDGLSILKLDVRTPIRRAIARARVTGPSDEKGAETKGDR